MKLRYFALRLSICLTLMLFFTMSAFADASNIQEIEKLLQQGSIDGYYTILAPLKGDPTNFNIKPTDDIKNIQFGKGIEGYTFNFDSLEKIVNNDPNKLGISEILVKKDQYYFPVQISGRDIGAVEVGKINGNYKVISMSSGGLLKNVEKATGIVNQSFKSKEIEMFYIEAFPYFNGYLIKTPEDYNFISIERLLENEKIKSFEIMPSKDIFNEIFSKYKELKSSSDSGGGLSAKEGISLNYLLTGLVILLVIGALALSIVRRIRFVRQD